jgi:multidrug efflux pump subunit AcrA (membrane-fusion protein)
MRAKGRFAIVTVLLAGLLSGCAEPPPPPVVAPRPVTVIKLEESDPVKPLMLTGSVTSWKEEDVAFEIDGRVEFVVEQGTHLEGRWVERGEVKAKGEVLALLDRRTYEISRDQAKAALEVAREQLATARVELEKVLPANLNAAAAERDRAKAEFVRFEKALKERSVSELEVIRSRADRDKTEADYQRALADIDTQKAELKALTANIEKAAQDLDRAEYDLQRTTLYAPFDAEVSEIYLEAGGYARTGQALAHLVMMNPIKIDLAVSAETAQRLKFGDVMRIRLTGQEELGYARVYDKATAADPATRTFRVSLLTRNRRVGTEFPEGDPRAKLIHLPGYISLIRMPDGVLYVEAKRALRRDEKGPFVWTSPGRTFRSPPDKDRIATLEKVHIELGDRYLNFQGIYLMREVTDAGGMVPNQLVAMGVPEDFPGGPAIFDRPDWQLRPGQLIPVLLDIEAPRPGFYVPMNSIRPGRDGSGTLFLLENGKAKAVPVTLADHVGQLVRIEGPGLTAGAQVVTSHIHFLRDGEAIRVSGRKEGAR